MAKALRKLFIRFYFWLYCQKLLVKRKKMIILVKKMEKKHNESVFITK